MDHLFKKDREGSYWLSLDSATALPRGAFTVAPHGAIWLVRSIDSWAPTIRLPAKLFSWQMYSKSSWPGSQNRKKPLVHEAVYAPGSSIVTSYFIVSESVRVNRSMRCSFSVEDRKSTRLNSSHLGTSY